MLGRLTLDALPLYGGVALAGRDAIARVDGIDFIWNHRG